LEGVDEVPACAKGDDTDCLDIDATPAAVENGPLVLSGAFEDTALEAKVEAADVYPEADCVPGVEAKALNEVVPKGDVEVKGFDVEVDAAAIVLAKADFEGSDLGTLNTDVLPKAFGVVARLEKADFAG
jgi:phage protein D